jgi:DNA repair exonuclease SbcCD ATPase subunit
MTIVLVLVVLVVLVVVETESSISSEIIIKKDIRSMTDSLLSPTAESRKSRLEILRERQKKLRESYKTQIGISRRTLNDDGEGETATAAAAAATASLTAISETPNQVNKKPITVDTRVPIPPSEPLTPTSASLLLLQTDNEALKRQVVALQADRELLLQTQMERFASASEQLNEMEELLEDYRNIAEESEENNAVLKAKVSLMTTENESLKTDNEQLTAQVTKQHQRLDSSVQAMNELEQDLLDTQEDLDLSDQRARTMVHQLRNMATTPPPVFHGQQHQQHQQHHGGTTYYPPPPGTTFYPMPQDAGGRPRSQPQHNVQHNNQQQYNDQGGQDQMRNSRSHNNKKKRR